MLAFAFIGVAIGVVYKRWGTGGVWALTLATLVLSGALVVLLTWRNWWDELGAWLADRSLVALAVGLPAAVAVVVAALSYAGIRRVVP